MAFSIAAPADRKPLADMSTDEKLDELVAILRDVQDALVQVSTDPMIKALSGGGGLAGMLGGLGRR